MLDELIGTTQSELSTQRLQHGGWNGGQVLEKCAEKSHGGQLQGVAEPIVLAAFVSNGGTIGIIQVEVARQLLGRGVALIPAVPFALRGA